MMPRADQVRVCSRVAALVQLRWCVAKLDFPIGTDGHPAANDVAICAVSDQVTARFMWAFVKTFKRDYARLSILPDAETVIALLPAWFEDYNEVHPHSGLKFLSPRQFLRLSA